MESVSGLLLANCGHLSVDTLEEQQHQLHLHFALGRPPWAQHWAADMLQTPLRWHQSALITLDVSYEKEKSSSRDSSVIGRSVQTCHPHQTPRPLSRPFRLSCTCFFVSAAVGFGNTPPTHRNASVRNALHMTIDQTIDQLLVQRRW